MCYPPGIPILAPGERVTREILEYIAYAKEKGCSSRAQRTRISIISMFWKGNSRWNCGLPNGILPM